MEGGCLGLFWEHSRNFPGGTYENREDESGQLVHRRRFELTTSLLQVSSVTADPPCSVAKYTDQGSNLVLPEYSQGVPYTSQPASHPLDTLK